MAMFEEFGAHWEDEDNWDEFDWQRFVQDADKQVVKFQKLYHRFERSPKAVELAARAMGWHPGKNTDDVSAAASAPNRLDRVSNEQEPPGDEPEAQHLHVQHHPAVVISSALHLDIEKLFQSFLDSHHNNKLPGLWIWWWSKSLGQAKRFSSMAFMALEMNDPGLCSCYMKYALKAINDSLTCVNLIPENLVPNIKLLKKRFYQRLFDMRSTYLRLMDVCREEVARRNEDVD